MSSPASTDLIIDSTARTAEQALADHLGHEFADPALLEVALTHRSWCAEHEGEPNERLEFLGDAVLDLVVAERSYRSHPDLPEGQLAKIRAGVVSAGTRAATARRIGLGDALRLGRGEEASGGSDKDSILADAMEAVLGAVYLDAGLAAAVSVIGALFDPVIEQASADPGIHDYKTRLQELAASRFGSAPRYQLTADGPDHDKRFSATVEVGCRPFGPGTGTSKKRAEQEAARIAWQTLDDDPAPPTEEKL